jgi:hypothetical protein
VGLLGPARLPPPILQRHAEVFRETMARPALRRRLLELGHRSDLAGAGGFRGDDPAGAAETGSS